MTNTAQSPDETISTEQLVRSLLKRHDPDTLHGLMQRADRELPALMRSGFEEAVVADTVKKIARRQFGAAFRTAEDAEWMTAEAGFALGLLTGLRFGGAR